MKQQLRAVLPRFGIVLGFALVGLSGVQMIETNNLNDIDKAVGVAGLTLLVAGVVAQELGWRSRH